MNIDEQIANLNTEGKAFFEHQTRTGTPHELIERQKELRSGMLDQSVGYNYPAAKLAMVVLGQKVAPEPVDEAQRQQSLLTKLAQRARNEGDEGEAVRLLERAGLDLSALGPRANDDVWKKREQAADLEYRRKRDDAIHGLQVDRDISKSEATRIFNGEQQDQVDYGTTGTMAETLKQQCTRNNTLRADRPIK
jgi:hypothetical protein